MWAVVVVAAAWADVAETSGATLLTRGACGRLLGVGKNSEQFIIYDAYDKFI